MLKPCRQAQRVPSDVSSRSRGRLVCNLGPASNRCLVGYNSRRRTKAGFGPCDTGARSLVKSGEVHRSLLCGDRPIWTTTSRAGEANAGTKIPAIPACSFCSRRRGRIANPACAATRGPILPKLPGSTPRRAKTCEAVQDRSLGTSSRSFGLFE